MRDQPDIDFFAQRTDQKGFWIISSIAVTRVSQAEWAPTIILIRQQEDIVAMIEDTKMWAREGTDGP